MVTMSKQIKISDELYDFLKKEAAKGYRPMGKQLEFLLDTDKVSRVVMTKVKVKPLPFPLVEERRRLSNMSEEKKIDGDTSDGYHTFNELYEYRMLYNALLFNEWYSQGKYDVHKSWRHNDGELCFGGGWFVVVADTPEGQITNHYPEEDWERFGLPEEEKASEWDGSTPEDVAHTLKALLEEEVSK